MRLVFLVALALAGCLGPRPLPTGPDVPVSPRALAAVADSLAAPGDRAAAVSRALARAGLTPLGDYSQRTVAPRFSAGTPPLVGAYLPGEHPLGRPELVVLSVPLASGAAPAVLEAARVLVERSRWRDTPDRTLLVAFPSGSQSGLDAALGAGLWPRSLVRAVVTVGAAPATIDGIPVVSVPAADGLALAQSLVDALSLAARYVPPPDTLAAR